MKVKSNLKYNITEVDISCFHEKNTWEEIFHNPTLKIISIIYDRWEKFNNN